MIKHRLVSLTNRIKIVVDRKRKIWKSQVEIKRHFRLTKELQCGRSWIALLFWFVRLRLKCFWFSIQTRRDDIIKFFRILCSAVHLESSDFKIYPIRQTSYDQVVNLSATEISISVLANRSKVVRSLEKGKKFSLKKNEEINFHYFSFHHHLEANKIVFNLSLWTFSFPPRRLIHTHTHDLTSHLKANCQSGTVKKRKNPD